MGHLVKIYDQNSPLSWANLDYLPDSNAARKEIYLIDDSDVLSGLIYLFYSLFGDAKERLIIFDNAWWDFCLETWNPEKNEYNYSLEDKSEETHAYLKMLTDSGIEVGYSGSCKCKDWDS